MVPEITAVSNPKRKPPKAAIKVIRISAPCFIHFDLIIQIYEQQSVGDNGLVTFYILDVT